MNVAIASLVPVIASIASTWLTPLRAEPIRVTELVHALASREKPAADRLAAQEELKKHHPRIVLPALLVEIEWAESQGDTAVPGYANPKPGSNGDRPSVALRRLWDDILAADWDIRLMKSDGDALPGVYIGYIGPCWKRTAIGKTLVGLLADSRSAHAKQLIIQQLRRYYTPEAEQPLAAIARNERDLEQLNAAEILFENSPRAAKYAPLFVGPVADTKRSTASRQLYLAALVPKGMGVLGRADRRRLTRAGFALLTENRDYFTANLLGELIGTKFTPDQESAKYQGEHGLTDVFFADTVSNALAWWADHRAEYESRTTQ